MGAMKEAMALTNWPNVSVEARLPPRITLSTKGFREVCISALPMPKSEKAMSNTQNVLTKTGITMAKTVMSRLSRTVRLRPMRFMSRLVGMEKTRNQKNTSEGSRFAMLSVSPRSPLM